MDLNTFTDLARKYKDLGWSVQEQLDTVISGDTEDINPNAAKLLVRFLKELQSEGVDVDWELNAVESLTEEELV